MDRDLRLCRGVGWTRVHPRGHFWRNLGTMANQTILVTGASSGFGRCLVEAALVGGHNVVATARKPETLAGLVAEYPTSCIACELDITKPTDCAEAIATGAARFGAIDILVNNAGYGLVGALEEVSEDQLRRNFETNLFGTVNMMRAVLPGMRARRRGTIINITAIAGICNEMGFAVYGGAKFAVEGVSEAVASEVRPLGIRVMIVEPGPFRTDFIGRSMESAETKISDYDGTSGKFATILAQINGRQKGDPAKAANVILLAALSDQPPSRLVLGKYAIDKLRRKLVSVEKDLAAWEELGAATDF